MNLTFDRIAKALKETNGVRQAAAKKLGVKPQLLNHYINKLGKKRFRASPNAKMYRASKTRVWGKRKSGVLKTATKKSAARKRPAKLRKHIGSSHGSLRKRLAKKSRKTLSST